jgi:hypothetical protein
MGRFSHRLKEFDRGFKPAEGGANRPGLDGLEDGIYECEILGAELIETPNTGQLILKWDIRVLSGKHAGYRCERPTFLESQMNIDYCGADFKTLGFDVDNWGTFSDEIEEAIPRLTGLKFRGKKVTKGQYHNLYINELISGSGSSRPKTQQQSSGVADYQEPAAGEKPQW